MFAERLQDTGEVSGVGRRRVRRRGLLSAELADESSSSLRDSESPSCSSCAV